jgi:uncharacterized protein RhaS with RHS repeats
MRERAYDATTGRFISSDPLGIAEGDTNTRRYVGNDPLSYIDPLGLKNYTWTVNQGGLSGGLSYPRTGLHDNGDKVTLVNDTSTGTDYDVNWKLYWRNGADGGQDPWVKLDLHEGDGPLWY